MATATTFAPRTANDRLKASFLPYLAGAITISAAIHFLALSRINVGEVADYTMYRAGELEQVILHQPEFEIPRPPEQIARPAIPMISADVNISEEITIAEIIFYETAAEGPPPPPVIQEIELSEEPAFTPFEVRPMLRNLPEFQKKLLDLYPLMLKQAGVGGIAVLWIFIDEEGTVQNTRIVESSGYPELDAVAEEAVRSTAKFTPALNRDIAVPVWIQMPITFEARS